MESYDYYLKIYGIGYWPMLNDLTIRIDEEMVRFSKWNDDSYLHRLDGPALIYNTNVLFFAKPATWFINDWNVDDEIKNWAKDNDIDLNNLTETDKALIKLIWSNYE